MIVRRQLSLIRINIHYLKLGKILDFLLIYRRFVNALNKRVGGKSNFVLLLEIYNKLIKFEAISFLKQS